MHDKILILDFGSQVTPLIARRIPEARGVARQEGQRVHGKTEDREVVRDVDDRQPGFAFRD